jgi:hypothetical protein
MSGIVLVVPDNDTFCYKVGAFTMLRSRGKWVVHVVLLVCASAAIVAGCSGNSRHGGKQESMVDCESSGNSRYACHSWIGE